MKAHAQEVALLMHRLQLWVDQSEAVDKAVFERWQTLDFPLGELDDPTRMKLVFRLLETGHEQEGRVLLHRWTAANWSGSQACNAMAVFLANQQRFDEANEFICMALARDECNGDAWNNRALIHISLGLPAEALVSAEQALKYGVSVEAGLFNKALALEGLHRLQEARAVYAELIQRNPAQAQAYAKKGLIELDLRKWTDARASLQRAWQLDATLAYIPSGVFLARQQLADWQHYDELRSVLVKGIEEDQPICEPFTLLSISDDPALQRRCAESHARVQFANPESYPVRVRRPGRIRIAYWSADLCTHAVGFLTAGLFAEHDRSQFEVFVYALRVDPGDQLQLRILNSVEHFRDMSQMSDDAIVRQARNDDLDLLIDLQGYTAGYRAKPLAQRLAAIQINYLGYPATMGTKVHDYMLVDPVMLPVERQHTLTEHPCWLSVCFQVSDDQRAVPQAAERASYGLPEDFFVFGCLYSFYKINPILMELWLQILQQVEQSVLWLVCDEPEARQSLRSYVEVRGLNPDRLIWAKNCSYEQHLARLRHIDLVLDTWPYGGGTSSNDALWMGVPVLTYCGQATVSRMSASLLHTMGVDELICTDQQQYVDRAIQFARQPLHLLALTMQIRDRLRRGRLFSTRQRARELERAYQQMYARSIAGEPPSALMLEPTNDQTEIPALNWPVCSGDKAEMQRLLQVVDQSLQAHDDRLASLALGKILVLCPELPAIRFEWILSLLRLGERHVAQIVLNGMEHMGVAAAAGFEAFAQDLIAQRSYGEALHLLQIAAKISPDKASTLNSMAHVLLEMECSGQAEQVMDQVITLEPDVLQWQINRASLWLRTGQTGQTKSALQSALRRWPDEPKLWYLFALAQYLDQDLDAAVCSCQTALQHDPVHADSIMLMTQIAQQRGAPEEAWQIVRNYLEQVPTNSSVWLQAHYIQLDRKQMDDADRFLCKAYAINPLEPLLLGRMLAWKLAQVDWSDFKSLTDQVISSLDAGLRCLQPLEALMLPIGAAKTRQAAEIYAEHELIRLRTKRLQRRPGRIRVVYVSSDFGAHAMAVLAAGLFSWHDRDRFEISLLSLRDHVDDAAYQRIRQSSEHFIDASRMGWPQIEVIRDRMDWDIAVDLNGPTEGHRLAWWGWGLAPVQVNYLGFPGTSGSAVHDYIIADPVVIPESEFPNYREQVIWLMDGFQVNDDQRPPAEARSKAQLGLPIHQPVLACFNASHKLNPLMFDLWMQIMQQAPDAVLWLIVDSAEVRQRLHAEAVARGVAAERLYFSERVSYQNYLNAITAADLVLDTLPFAGGTSSSDVLWAGTPLLTCPGDTFAGRMTASLLHSAGMSGLIAPTLSEYVARAVHWMLHPNELEAMRQQLALSQVRAKLFDTQAKVRQLEKAYEMMHERSERRVQPGHLRVDAIQQCLPS